MYEYILVVRMSYGKIDSISREYRMVYTNSKGRFIKTTSDGNWYLKENVAIISYRNVVYGMASNGMPRHRRVKADESLSAVKSAVEELTKEFFNV